MVAVGVGRDCGVDVGAGVGLVVWQTGVKAESRNVKC